MSQLILTALPYPPSPIIFIPSNMKVVDCIELMIEKDIGALVVQDNGLLKGIVSERDIVRSSLHFLKNPLELTAGEIAFKNVTILQSNDSLENAMKVITQTKRRHILIQENEQLIAILSIGDLLFHLLEDKAQVIQHLENYIHN